MPNRQQSFICPSSRTRAASASSAILATPLEPRAASSPISFELDGQQFTALNGGPTHPFTDAISFSVRCDTQDEIDYYWSKLTAGGSEVACGWLKDKFGLSWQIVPARIHDLVKNSNAMRAMMKMKKLDIAELERAAKA
jgi:predicted 3-demethylubiquinone-9 3-methyltransferase (glyoxalase superfamily)